MRRKLFFKHAKWAVVEISTQKQSLSMKKFVTKCFNQSGKLLTLQHLGNLKLKGTLPQLSLLKYSKR